MERGNGGGAKAVVGEQYCEDRERELTVRKTSLFFPGDGFVAYDHDSGDLVFRVDNYDRGPSLTDELVLMDPAGASILTLLRKWPSLHNRWEGYLGERAEGQKPRFTVRRSSIFGGDRAGVSVEVHGGDGDDAQTTMYRVDGSFAARCCQVLHEGNREEEELVAEVKRKVDAVAQVVLGRDVFCLCLSPSADAAFVMGLVLVLDRISGDDDVGAAVDPAAVAPADVLEEHDGGSNGGGVHD
ncbi:Protein LURP-one-related 12 [Apostasia shenzhenica]|uniref:Protein LURP-one-related 12 n=1 Tax=Apostasia shenzhenica TaxID=1088818 RepID=A0A2I0A0J6_9ASPA|nr:Protein LURP-one-related 12 [Apostasia shenzhenica]